MRDSHYIDPEIKPILDLLANQFGQQYSQLSIKEIRERYSQAASANARPLPDGCTDGRVNILGPAGNIECRYFKPVSAGSNLPVVLHFLGGTYVATSLDHVGQTPAALAMTLNCLVVVPLHRIPPEAPYPAAYDDCFYAYKWLLEQASTIGGDAKRIVVLGESSGGTLAAAVCIDARDVGLAQPLLQVLAEPLLDHESETSSINEFSYVLSKEEIRYGSKLYFGEAIPPRRASPLRAESLQGLSPAYIISAGLDPLRDEAIAYVARLGNAGVPVIHRHHDGQIHGFFSMFEQTTQSKIAFLECCAAINFAFADGFLPPSIHRT